MLHTRTSLENAISSLLGGTLAEELLLGEASDGCTSDLQRATQIARRMVAEFGMSRALGRLNYAREAVSGGSDQAWSEQTAREIDLEVRRIIEAAETRAREVLETRRETLEQITARLIDRETIDAAELQEILGPIS